MDELKSAKIERGKKNIFLSRWRVFVSLQFNKVLSENTALLK